VKVLSWLALALVVSVALPAGAQRRRTVAPPPVVLTFAPDATPGASAHRWVVSLRATADVDVSADRRLLWLEVRPEGARRALRCEAPVRPRRLDAARVRSLHGGETWAEWLDVRSVCWGAALRALESGASVTAHFGSPRWRTLVVAHDATSSWREIVQPAVTIPALAPVADPTSPIRVSLAPADAATGRRLPLRVTVRAGTAPVRAWIRPDRFRFRVLAPDGSTHTCSIPRAGGAAIPDLFARLSPSRGAMRALDATQYCGPSVFALEGVYEVTPILELDAGGSQWGMDTPLGVFEGAPTAVRIRSGEHGYVEHPIGGAS
jgi:hypothetical protein